MVSSAITSENAPLPTLSAGDARPLPKSTSRGTLLWIQCWTWYLATRCPIQPRPCSALLTYAGSVVGQVGDPVVQRQAERHRQAEEDQQPPTA